VTGRTVRAERERRQAKRPKQALARSKVYAALIAVGVLVLAAVAVYFSPAFTIKNIAVEGTWHLNAEYLTELAQVPSGSTLLRIDTEQIAERVSHDPWVASVKLTRDFPSGLVITIVERQPVAMVLLEGADLNSGRGMWLLASDSVWLGEVIDIDQSIQGLESSQLVRISDLPSTVEAQAGRQATDLSLLNALAIVNGVSSPMKAMIDLISAPSVAATTLYLSNNVEVVFGSAEDVEKKELVINQLIAEHGSTLIRINVRVADRPTIKQSAEPHSD
jgi:cell division protein FtsQ